MSDRPRLPITLADLAETPLWVAWQAELRRRGDEKPTKVPYAPDGRKAEAGQPATWGTRPQAEKRAAMLPKPYGMGGIGLELAALGDGRRLGGVDLDTCRSPETGALESWAEDTIASFDSYAEVSPSGTGAKLFFTYTDDALIGLRQHMGDAEWGKQFKLRGEEDHPPAIELYLGNRYFAVTDQILAGSRADLRHVEPDLIERLIRVDGPAFAGAAVHGAKRRGALTGSADQSRSSAAFRIGAEARRKGGDFKAICDAIRDHEQTAGWYAEKGTANGYRELHRIWDRAAPVTGTLILNSAAPLMSARQFILRHHTVNGAPTLLHQNGSFYEWRGSHYVERAAEEMRAALYRFLDEAKTYSESKKLVPFNPSRNKVANVLEATAAEAQVSRVIRPPAWLSGADDLPAAELISCRNGILHLPSRQLHQHTPNFFTLNALAFDYDREAPEPRTWLAFLRSIWPSDPEAISTLQEIFGLGLTAETRHQKGFVIVGPKRSGKGTIARVLTKLLGAANVCGPTLSSLSQNFGLAPLIGKRLAIISDARLSGRADQQVIVERLLSVTGEDSLTIDRKFREGWTGKLDARFLILTNELPRLTDSSGALAGRFVILTMQRSFYGQEDLGLDAKLTPELPGILLWAIAGWERLRERGYFVAPKSSAAAQQELEDLGSPIGAFLRDRCEIGPSLGVRCDELYQAWGAWCREHGRDHAGTTQTFGRDLRAAVPGLSVRQPRDEHGKQQRYYEGVGFTADFVVTRDDTRTTALRSQLSPSSETYPHDIDPCC